jgi:hypothetical protein
MKNAWTILRILILSLFLVIPAEAADSTAFNPIPISIEYTSGLFNEEIITSSGSWTVPEGVSTIHIKANGAGGGGGDGHVSTGGTGGNTTVTGSGLNIIAFGGHGGRGASDAHVNSQWGGFPHRGGTGGTSLPGAGASGGGGQKVTCPGHALAGFDGNSGGLVSGTYNVISGQTLNIGIGIGGVGHAYGISKGANGAKGYVIIRY